MRFCSVSQIHTLPKKPLSNNVLPHGSERSQTGKTGFVNRRRFNEVSKTLAGYKTNVTTFAGFKRDANLTVESEISSAVALLGTAKKSAVKAVWNS